MTDLERGSGREHDQNDIEPGGPGVAEATPRAAIAGYSIGLALSIALTIASFYVLDTTLIWKPALPVALVTLAVAQIGVHLVFFLHITTAPDNTNNVLALAFGILIVALIVAGSLWIMVHLDHRMMPMDEVMRMQR